MFKGLRTVVYHVPDLDEAKQWFAAVLGFDAYFHEPYYVGFNVGGFELGLLPFDESESSAVSITYWGVNDIDEAYRALLDKGCDEIPDGEVKDVGDGIKVAKVRNPMGNVVGIIVNPHFKIED